MRRIVVYLVVAAVAVALVFVLRQRKRAFVAAQVQLLQSDDPDEAAEARKRLQRVGRSAVRPVCALLKHKSKPIRVRAAVTLANIGHPAACGPLMEAAKRGNFPAADALAFMNHPRADEARAWAYCRLADKALEELEMRLPIGGRLPTGPAADWREPRGPFQHRRALVIKSLDALASSRWPWVWTSESSPQPWDPDEKPRASRWYDRSLKKHRLPEALIGHARLRQLCGDYAGAAQFYAEALALDPENAAAQSGKTSSDRLAELSLRMVPLLPQGFRIDRVLTHPLWRQGDTDHYVAVVSLSQTEPTVFSIYPGLIVFEQGREGLTWTAALDAGITVDDSLTERARGSFVGLAAPSADSPPTVALIQFFWEISSWKMPDVAFDVALYRLEDGALRQTLQLPSDSLPWVGDIDDDGDAEIVTWRNITPDVQLPRGFAAIQQRWPSIPQGLWQPEQEHFIAWPTVRSMVDGEYVIRTEQFPRLFEPMPAALAEAERDYPINAMLSDCLGLAYEILGESRPAIQALERAERKHLAVAEDMANKGDADHEQVHRQAVADVRARRLALEAKLEGTTGTSPGQAR